MPNFDIYLIFVIANVAQARSFFIAVCSHYGAANQDKICEVVFEIKLQKLEIEMK